MIQNKFQIKARASLLLSMFHINTACFLSKNIDDLEYLLKTTNMNFDIIGISETRIRKNISKISNISLYNYFFEFTPTEFSVGVALPTLQNVQLLNQELAFKFRKT